MKRKFLMMIAVLLIVSTAQTPVYGTDFDQGVPEPGSFVGEFDPKTVIDSEIITESKIITNPDTMISFAIPADAADNPNIIDYVGAAIMGSNFTVFLDATTGMPAYCLDMGRQCPVSESLLGGVDPEEVFGHDTYEGLMALLLAGYPFETGGLTNDQAHACTQLAVWAWMHEKEGNGFDLEAFGASLARGEDYDFFMKLLNKARNQTPPNLGLSATAISMVKSGNNFIGETTVTFYNLQGGYTLNKDMLPDGMTVSGDKGKNGDVLTFTAPFSFADQSFTIEDILLGHDERSPLNLFWYDNSDPDQQRIAIPIMNQTAVAFSAGITFHFPAPTEPNEPTVPTEPNEPTVPTKPNEPTVPTEPTEPAGPTEPTEPTGPTVPTKPTEPAGPTEPNEPAGPVEPTDPKEPMAPPQPTIPGHTIVPGENGTYIEFDINDEPIGQWVPGDNGVWIFEELPPLESLPKTGADDTVSLWISSLCASLSMTALLFWIKYGRKRV